MVASPAVCDAGMRVVGDAVGCGSSAMLGSGVGGSGVGDGAVISTCTGWVSVGSGVSVASGVGVAGRGVAVITITTGVLVGLPGSPSISSDTSPTATPA